jgi:hypothetical protein
VLQLRTALIPHVFSNRTEVARAGRNRRGKKKNPVLISQGTPQSTSTGASSVGFFEERDLETLISPLFSSTLKHANQYFAKEAANDGNRQIKQEL